MKLKTPREIEIWDTAQSEVKTWIDVNEPPKEAGEYFCDTEEGYMVCDFGNFFDAWSYDDGAYIGYVKRYMAIPE